MYQNFVHETTLISQDFNSKNHKEQIMLFIFYFFGIMNHCLNEHDRKKNK
jgi:hypothetical protein